jgi:hypothetical protein
MDNQNQNTPPPSTSNAPRHVRANPFFEIYANNVSFQMNLWDLNVVFSVLDQQQAAGTPTLFRQLGSVHVAWPQAKVMAYYFLMNIAFHEAAHGPIEIPKAGLPQPFEEYAKAHLPDTDQTKALIERGKRIAAELGI